MKKFLIFGCVALFVAAVSCQKNTPVTPDPDGPGQEDTTATVVSADFTFELLAATPSSIEVAVTPKDPGLRYFWTIIPRTVYEGKYMSDMTAAALATVELWTGSFADYGYESFEALYNDQTVIGRDTVVFDGYNQRTDLYCMAFGVDMSASLTTEVAMSEMYTTGEVEMSDNTFTVSRYSDSPSETIVKVEPSNDDPYLFHMVTKEAFEQYGSPLALAEEYVEVNAAWLDVLLCSGTGQRNFYETFDIYGSGDYVVYVFGYYAGVITTDVTTYNLTYEEYVPDPELGEPFSRLTGDVSFEATGAYWEEGLTQFDDNAATVFLAIQAESTYYGQETRLGLFLQTDSKGNLPDSMEGVYEVRSTMAAGTVVRGWRDAETEYLEGSYYYEKDSYSIDATVDSGTVTVTKESNGDYTIDVKLSDMNGYAITTTYTGPVTFQIPEE
ncbi:MAG TPA: hypothetical protein IAC03_08080 [Candidatus Coprenecus pullistercoris]|nr:hypothetical protein [Candidatus Coprenecus pullistercoris]